MLYLYHSWNIAVMKSLCPLFLLSNSNVCCAIFFTIATVWIQHEKTTHFLCNFIVIYRCSEFLKHENWEWNSVLFTITSSRFIYLSKWTIYWLQADIVSLTCFICNQFFMWNKLNEIKLPIQNVLNFVCFGRLSQQIDLFVL